jgi:hypothetical protein
VGKAMFYEKLENGNLLIGVVTKDEQAVIDAIIAAIEAYKATFVSYSVSPNIPPEPNY